MVHEWPVECKNVLLASQAAIEALSFETLDPQAPSNGSPSWSEGLKLKLKLQINTGPR